MSRRSTRHAARRAKRLASTPTRLLLATLSTVAVIVLGVLAGGGTYALWSVSAPAAAATTLKAGSAGLTVTDPMLAASGLYPGRTVFSGTEVRNTGSVPLSLTLHATSSAAPTAFTTALQLTAGTPTAPGECGGTLTAPATTSVGGAAVNLVTVEPGATIHLCVGLRLPLDAPTTAAGAAASGFTLTISGTQVLR
ncbi:hypothetical protein [Microbacterium sp. zg-YB36]|uniref:hypothetical protein n=1 Tax=Microbacterium sp. zg-YB36 TaxID=2969407 RepID=UPI00214C784B|nr:hypothetical protein [Microbacterium sp. zg-YB36]MDL5352061.1 hypothetical protein [Microbacterium sp. zg-YB36]